MQIASNIMREILRKYLNSFSSSGFSGVSSGQKTKISTVHKTAPQSNTVLKSNIFENLITAVHAKRESEDDISHLASVEA